MQPTSRVVFRIQLLSRNIKTFGRATDVQLEHCRKEELVRDFLSNIAFRVSASIENRNSFGVFHVLSKHGF